jgi:hypothetical protein
VRVCCGEAMDRVRRSLLTLRFLVSPFSFLR